MEFRQTASAHPLLAGRVLQMISARGYRPDHARERVLPKDCVDLVVDLTDRPKALFAGAEGGEVARFHGAWISGLRQGPLVIEAARHSDFVILRLSVSGAFALLGGALGEIAGTVTPLDAIIGPKRTAELRDALGEAPEAEERFRRAEAWLVRAIHHDPAPEIAWLAAQLARDPALRLGALTDRAGYSERYLRRAFRDQIGLSPKRFQRLMRFRGVLQGLARGRGETIEDLLLSGAPLHRPSWAGLAAHFGYADQSHLHAEFAAFSGLTPGRYAAQFRGMTDHLPILP